MPRSARYRANVQSAEPLSPTVRRVILALDGPFTHEAGQAVFVEVRGAAGSVRRAPYSIASAPGEHGPGTLEIAVAEDRSSERASSTATALRDLTVGAEVLVEGPVGAFTRSGERRESAALFVGAGTGVSPLRAMIADAVNAPPVPLLLLFGAREESELLWRDDLDTLAHRMPHFQWLASLSRPRDPAAVARRGHVQAHLDEALAALGRQALAFVCGPPAMVTSVSAALLARGWNEERIVRDLH